MGEHLPRSHIHHSHLHTRVEDVEGGDGDRHVEEELDDDGLPRHVDDGVVDEVVMARRRKSRPNTVVSLCHTPVFKHLFNIKLVSLIETFVL